MAAVFTSWKEIAAYRGKGVRTVQRWEHELQLPVRRADRSRHIVLAVPEELDAWIRRQSQARQISADNSGRAQVARMRILYARFVESAEEFRRKTVKLQETISQCQSAALKCKPHVFEDASCLECGLGQLSPK